MVGRQDKLLRLALMTLALSLAAGVHAADRNLGYRLASTYDAPNRDGIFFLEPSRRYGLEELFLVYADRGLYLNASAYGEQRDGDTPRYHGVVNEFYVDTKSGEWDVTVGKKRLEWGVGFGFRPLDVLKPAARRELVPLTPEGLPLVALERYSAQTALTLLVANDFHHNDDGWRAADTEYAARYYALVNGVDVQVIAHRRSDIDYETGAAFSWVANDEWEWHGSALFQHQYQKLVNTLTGQNATLLATSDPMVTRTFDDGLKAVLGSTYTWRSGHALMLEYWYDDAGYSKAEWQRLRALTEAQRALLGSSLTAAAAAAANIGASAGYLTQPNLMQQNLLLRWSYDNGEHFVPALDLLYTPQDRGAVLTFSASHQLGTRYALNYGARYYGGAEDSVYRALPQRYLIYVDFKASFNW